MFEARPILGWVINEDKCEKLTSQLEAFLNVVVPYSPMSR
jgi:hypothetical protein